MQDWRRWRVAKPLQRVLVLNPGSSSLKWSVLRADTEQEEAGDSAGWHGRQPGAYADAVRSILERQPDVGAVGHRVVHGGAAFTAGALIDPAVRRAIADLCELAPLHNPIALAGIDAVSAARPDLPQVAAFDTAFHQTMPPAAAAYAVPHSWTLRFGARRYGFHGLSVAYALRRSGELLGAQPRRLAVCHLGAGCSITAVESGRSVDTSMGFTPLEGMMMGTRSGSVDPGLLLYLLTQRGVPVDELDDALNYRSGLAGVSELSGDLREVLSAADAGNEQARLAYALFIRTLVRHLGQMIGVLGGLDAVVFTGGIGEHSARVRADVGSAFAFLGLYLDEGANGAAEGDRDLATRDSAVRVLAIAAREDLSVLAEVRRLIG